MGKVKTAIMDASQEAQVQAKAAAKRKNIVIWEELYSDLAPRIAKALREARVKPEQLASISDGEITAIGGIGEVALEEIRAKYPADLTAAKSAPDSKAVKETQASSSTPRRPRHPNRGGKRIKAVKSKVDRSKLYSLAEAVKLVKATNLTSFDATLTLHLNLKEKLSRLEVTFPYLAGKTKRIAIADDQLLKDIAAGKLEFDLLLATPAMMPKLAKYAKLLGPKGLMPNPKSGTVTPNPEAKKKEFVGGKTIIKGEPKFPLMHIVVGKLSQPNKELVTNIQAALAAVKANNLLKATLAATMSPGIKIQI